MKKFVSLFLVLALLLSFTGCGGNAASGSTAVSDPGYPWGIEAAPLTGGQSSAYQTVCYQDTSLVTNGRVEVTGYVIEETDDPSRVNKVLDLRFTFSDTNARQSGIKYGVIYADRDDVVFEDGEGDMTVSYGDKEDTVRVLRDEFYGSEWINGLFVGQYTLVLNMPADYNEFALMVVDYGKALEYQDEEGNYIEGFALADVARPDTPWFLFDDQEYIDGASDASPASRGLEVADWNVTELDRNGVTEVVFDLTAFSTMPGDEITVNAYYDEDPAPFTNQMAVLDGEMDRYDHSFSFSIDGTATDAAYVTFEFLLTNGNEISSPQYMTMPFIGNADSSEGGTPVITIDDLELDGSDISMDVTVQNWNEGDQLWALVYEPGATDTLHNVNYDLAFDDNHFGFAMDGAETKGDTLIFEFVVTDSTGKERCCEVKELVWK